MAEATTDEGQKGDPALSLEASWETNFRSVTSGNVRCKFVVAPGTSTGLTALFRGCLHHQGDKGQKRVREELLLSAP